MVINGPNIVNDELLLSIDAVSLKSFRGEPTTNLRLLETNGEYLRIIYLDGIWSYNGIQTTGEFEGWEKITATRTSTSNRLIMFINGITSIPETQYTVSVEFVSPFNNLTFNVTGNQGVGDVIRIGDTNRYYRTFTKNINSGGMHLYLASTEGDGNFDITDGIIYYRFIQWETMPYPTFWVNGSRGTTVDTGGGVIDMSGNGNNGEIVGNIIYNGGFLGSFDFPGIINNSIESSIDMRRDFSFECWVNYDTVSGFSFFGQGPRSNNNGLHVLHRTSTSIRFGMYNNDTDFLGLVSAPNTWYHLVFTYQNSAPFTKQAFLNSTELVGTPLQTQGQYTGTGIFRIGATYSINNNFADGRISMVRIYNKILTQSEILTNYNSTKNRYNQ